MSRIEQVLTVSKEMIKKEDYENYSKLNQSLHMEIWTAAGNEKLKENCFLNSGADYLLELR